MEDLIHVISELASPNNQVRNGAEQLFHTITKQNPTAISLELVKISLNESIPIDTKQSALLLLRKLIPIYWSIAFPGFTGPPIMEKDYIRSNLLSLLSHSSSKIRSSASYVITQIAASDFPDEWPSLILSLIGMISLPSSGAIYRHASSDVSHHDYPSDSNHYSIVGALSLFNDLFTDLITDEQFWDNNLASLVIEKIGELILSDLPLSIKTSPLSLYLTITENFTSESAFLKLERANYVIEHIKNIFPLLLNLLNQNLENLQTGSLDTSLIFSSFKYYSLVFRIIHYYILTFDKKIDISFKERTLQIALDTLNCVANDNFDNPNFDLKTTFQVKNLRTEILLTINASTHSVNIPPQYLDQIHSNLINLATIPSLTLESYEEDVNVYVTDITGLDIDSLRESISTTLSELNDTDAVQLFNTFKIINVTSNLEPQIFLIQCLLQNDAEINDDYVLEDMSKLINFDTDQFTSSRYFLLLPHYFEKFDVEGGVKSITQMIDFAFKSNSLIVKFSALVSLVSYKSQFDLDSCFEVEEKLLLQNQLFKMIDILVDESDDDSLAALMDAVDVGIEIDATYHPRDVIDLIFKIAFKDPANIQISSSVTECLQATLKYITNEDYISSCERSLPFIYDIIDKSTSSGGSIEYSPELYLSLEFLGIILPVQEVIPESIFQYTYPIIEKLILSDTDSQILQSAGEVYNSLLKKGSTYINEDMKNSLLLIISKFISPELSDSAALSSGLIILSIVENFQEFVGQSYLTQILEATARRLIISKHSTTTENLILVFCNLVLTSPKEMIDFLSELNLLEKILPIWFHTFEVLSGFENIKQNALAFIKIYMLKDSRIENMMVNGDIIPYTGEKIITRSMSQNMPTNYTQVPAPYKIIKLLIGELAFQNEQPEEDEDGEGLHGEGGGDGEEDWEDMADIGIPSYDRLRSYVEDDERPVKNIDDRLNKMLQGFFVECVAENWGGFQRYYDMLSDQDKKTLTEHIAF